MIKLPKIKELLVDILLEPVISFQTTEPVQVLIIPLQHPETLELC
jgi:hypothetical protein